MTGTPQQPRSSSRRILLVVLVVTLLSVGATIARAWSHRSPYGPEDLHAKVSLTSYPDGDAAQRAVDAAVGAGRLTVPVGQAGRLVVGRLTFDVPKEAAPGDDYALFVLDADDRPASAIWGVATAGNVASGWDGRYDAIAGQYPWLSRLRSVSTDQGSSDPGAALSWKGGTQGPVTFVATVDDGRAGDDPDVDVALALLNDDTVRWATHVDR